MTIVIASLNKYNCWVITAVSFWKRNELLKAIISNDTQVSSINFLTLISVIGRPPTFLLVSPEGSLSSSSHLLGSITGWLLGLQWPFLFFCIIWHFLSANELLFCRLLQFGLEGDSIPCFKAALQPLSHYRANSWCVTHFLSWRRQHRSYCQAVCVLGRGEVFMFLPHVEWFPCCQCKTIRISAKTEAQ